MRLTVFSAVVSVALAVALVAVFILERSVLAAAQAADSAADVLVAVGFAVAVWIGRAPPDHTHHYGHGQAEPVAALIAAFVAAQLGISVIQEAIAALRGDPLTALGLWVAAVFAAKVAVKLFIAFFAFRGRAKSSVLDALAVDARNDVLVGFVALIGYVAVDAGFGRIDAILGLAVGAFVVFSALMLAGRSVKLLMGQAPDRERLAALEAVAGSVDGVILVEDLRARTSGNGIEVSLCVGVDDSLTVDAAHHIADAVERALEDTEGVSTAEVHVHPARPAGEDVEPGR